MDCLPLDTGIAHLRQKKLAQAGLGQGQPPDSVKYRNQQNLLSTSTAFVMRKNLAKKISAHQCSLTPEEYAMLEAINSEGGNAQKELIIASLKDKTTVTRIISSLAKKKLVRRSERKADRRAFRIFLTTDGKKVQSQVRSIAEEVTHQAKVGITPDDLATTIRTLNFVFNNFR